MRGHHFLLVLGVLSVMSLIVFQTPLFSPTSEPITKDPTVDFRKTGLSVGPQQLAYGRLPMSFEANQGQSNSEFKYLARGQGYGIFLAPTESVLALHRNRVPASNGKEMTSQFEMRYGPLSAETEKSTDILRLKLIGANSNAQGTGLDPLPGKMNYFIGNDPKNWKTNIATFCKVRFDNVYPGVDLIYYGNQRQLEYDLVLAPGTNPEIIQFEIEGAERIEVDAEGGLQLHTANGVVRQLSPRVYQEENGNRRLLEGNYVLKGERHVGFEIPSYDSQRKLVIDPVLVYSTYLGGSSDDKGFSIAVDSSGSAYVAGSTYSADFPSTNVPYPDRRRGYDVFAAKLNPAGTALAYCTIIGGYDVDEGYGIAVDSAGNAYVVGYTASSNFPTVNPLQPSDPDISAFVFKLNSTGSALVYSTYWGNLGNDFASGVAVDSGGNAYVVGWTFSINFPKTNVKDGLKGLCDVFVTKFNEAGKGPVYSTLIGGSNYDYGYKIVVDSAGSAYIAGATASLDFWTVKPPQSANGGDYDGFAAKLNPSGTDWIYSTYIGGNGRDTGAGIAIDAAGNAYVAGRTASTNFPVANAFQSRISGTVADAFVTKLNPSGSGWIFSTYLGGTLDDGGNDLAVDAAGNVTIVGYTYSTNFPNVNPFQTAFGGGDSDAFVAKFNAAGSALLYSSFLGGSGKESLFSTALDSAGNAYVTGWSTSNNFPVRLVNEAVQSVAKGGQDVIIAKIGDTAATTTTTTTTTTTFIVGTPRGAVDQPAPNSRLSGDATLGGWAVVVSGNVGGLANRIDLFVDGAYAVQLANRVARLDVQQYLAGQGINAPANLGFSGTWNSRTVADGPHTLSFRAADAAAITPEVVVEIAQVNVITDNGIAPPSTTTTTTTSTTTSTRPTTTTTTLPSNAPSLSVGNVSGVAGAQVTVPVELYFSGASQLSGVVFDVNFSSSSLLFVQAAAGPAAANAQKSVTANAIGNTGVRIIVFGLNQNVIGNGTIVSLDFLIRPGTSPGRTPLSIGGLQGTSPTGGTITVIGYSGYVDVVTSSTGGTTTTTTSTRPTTTTTTSTTTTLPPSMPTLSVGNASGLANSQVTIPVNLNVSAGAQVSGVVFDISYNSASLLYVQTSAGSAATNAQKSVTANALGTSGVRVIVFGLNQNAMASGTVANLVFLIRPGTAPGRVLLDIGNLQGTSPTGGTVNMAGYGGYVDVVTATTTTTTTTSTIASTTTTSSTTTTTQPGQPSQASLVFETCGGVPGGTLDILIQYSHSVDISDVQFEAVFDSNMLSISDVSPGAQVLQAGKNLNREDLTSGRVRFTIGSPSNKRIIGNGDLLSLQFRISASAVANTTTQLNLVRGSGTSPQGTYYSIPDVQRNVDILTMPVLDYITPSVGSGGTLLMLSGTNLGSCPSSTRIVFLGASGERTVVIPRELTPHRLVVAVPSSSTGNLSVSIKVAGAETSTRGFKIDPSVPFSTLSSEIESPVPLAGNAVVQGTTLNRRTNTGYVADNFNGTVSVVDVGTGRKISDHTLQGGNPAQLAVNATTGQVVVTQTSTNRISILQRQSDNTLSSLGQVTVGTSPLGVAVNPQTNTAVVVNNGSNNVSVVDLAQRRVIAIIPVSAQPISVAIDVTRNRAFVTSRSDNSVIPIDLNTNRALQPIPMGSMPLSVEYHSETGTLLVGTNNGLVIGNVDRSQYKTIASGEAVDEIALHPTRGLVSIFNNGAGTVKVIDLSTSLSDPANSVIGVVPLKRINVQGAAVNQYTNQGLVGHNAGGGTGGRGEDGAGVSGFSVVNIPSSLNFPRVMAQPGDQFSVALSNPTVGQATMQMTAINSGGQLLRVTGLNNPATFPVPAGGQTAKFDFDRDLFGEPVKAANDLWYKLVTPNPGLKAFFLSGDFFNNTAMVGAEETGTLLSDFILPAVRPNYSNYISLINPLPIQASVTLKLIGNNGAELESIDRTIPRYGLLQKGIEELFSSGLGQIGSVGGGYVRVTSLTAIRGYQLVVHQDKRDPAGLNAQSAATGPSSLTFTHFVAGRDAGIGVDYETRVALINLDTTTQNLTLRIRDNFGNEIAPAQQLNLPPNGRVEPEIRQLFNLPTTTRTEGWLKVDGTGRLAGYITYATNEAFAAVVSLIEPRTQLTFSHVAESRSSNGYYTGLAILNANAEPTTVKISVYGMDGKLTASSESFEISPGGRKIGLLREPGLVGPAVIDQPGGYVVVTSSLPVHGIEIFGTLSMKAFANVPAQ